MRDGEIASTNYGYFVPSLSQPGYFLLVAGADCTCKAAQMGNESCRHRRAVRDLVREQDRLAKRPIAPPNVRALVDDPPYRPTSDPRDRFTEAELADELIDLGYFDGPPEAA